MKKLYRCRWDKKIGGVFGGLGQYFRIDPTALRMGFIALSMITMLLPGLVIYLLAWLIIPLGPVTYVQIKGKKLYRSIVDRKLSGVIGGFAEYFYIDSNLLRLIYVILLFFTGFAPLFLFYIAGIFLIPERRHAGSEQSYI